jgi:hypothetical protein
MSLTAPMVQKWVRWAIAPKMAEVMKAAHRTCVVRVLSVEISMPGFYRHERPIKKTT